MVVFVEDSFDSAHQLPNVPEDHKCRRLHGHTYRIRIEVEGEVDPQMGWVIDYSEIKRVWDPVKAELDHHELNAVPGLQNPTCEHLARWIWHRMTLQGLVLSRIELRETVNCGVVLSR